MNATTLIKDVESIAGKAEQELDIVLKTIDADAPTIEQIASTTLTIAGPILSAVVSLEGGPAAGAALTGAIAIAQQGIAAAKIITAATGSASNASGVLASIQTQLSTILADVKVSDPKSVALVTLVISGITALVNAFTPAAPTAPAAPAESATETADESVAA